MSYQENIESHYRSFETLRLLASGQDPIKVGESFLMEEMRLRTFSPFLSTPHYIGLTAHIVGKLGLNRSIKTDFDPNRGLTDKEIEYLIDQDFDLGIAKALVHMGLFYSKNFKNKLNGTVYEDINKHLEEAEACLNYSRASDRIKFMPQIILDVLKTNKN